MKKILLSLTACLALLASCGIDNYDEPTGSISGGIYDAETQELIPAQSPNGARVQVVQDATANPPTSGASPTALSRTPASSLGNTNSPFKVRL